MKTEERILRLRDALFISNNLRTYTVSFWKNPLTVLLFIVIILVSFLFSYMYIYELAFHIKHLKTLIHLDRFEKIIRLIPFPLMTLPRTFVFFTGWKNTYVPRFSHPRVYIMIYIEVSRGFIRHLIGNNRENSIKVTPRYNSIYESGE